PILVWGSSSEILLFPELLCPRISLIRRDGRTLRYTGMDPMVSMPNNGGANFKNCRRQENAEDYVAYIGEKNWVRPPRRFHHASVHLTVPRFFVLRGRVWLQTLSLRR